MSSTVGFAISLLYGSTNPGTTAIAEVIDCAFPDVSVEQFKTTSHATANGYHTYAPKPLADMGDLAAKIAVQKTEYSTLLGLVGTEKWWRVSFPGIGTWDFQGFISKLGGGSFSAEDPVQVETDMTITPTSKPTFTAV